MTEAMMEAFDGHVAEVEINRPGWVLAGRLTDLDTGASWRYVYRSPLVKTNGGFFREVLDWLDGAEQFGDAESYRDDQMMHGSGIMTLWEA